MYTVKRTTSIDPDFINLVKALDIYLTGINGETDSFYAQYNKIDIIKHVVVVYEGLEAVGCGAIKEFDPSTIEIKRMYVLNEKRGRGIANLILVELQNWAKELGYKRCVLETGITMADAIGLYTKNSFKIIENYGQYHNVQSSICFSKELQ